MSLHGRTGCGTVGSDSGSVTSAVLRTRNMDKYCLCGSSSSSSSSGGYHRIVGGARQGRWYHQRDPPAMEAGSFGFASFVLTVVILAISVQRVEVRLFVYCSRRM